MIEKNIFVVRSKLGTQDLELNINFDEENIIKVKEMRNLFKLPLDTYFRFSIKYKFSNKIWPKYLMASSLKETVDLFNYLYTKIDNKIEKLLARQLKEIQAKISQGCMLKWSDDKNIPTYITELGDQINNIEDTARFIIEKTEDINNSLEMMRTCDLDLDIFRAKILDIQKILDEFSFKRYANLHLWVKDLEISVEQVLSDRLKDLIELWLYEFENYKQRDRERKLIKENTVHEIKVQNQTLLIEPSTEYARAFWMNHFHSSLGIICNLQKLDAGSYNVWNKTTTKQVPTYHSLLNNLAPEVMTNAYQRINNILVEADKYVNTWLNYQALWEIGTENVYDQLGNDISLW